MFFFCPISQQGSTTPVNALFCRVIKVGFKNYQGPGSRRLLLETG